MSLAVALAWPAAVAGQSAQAQSAVVFRIDDRPGEIHLSDSPVAAAGATVTPVLYETPDGLGFARIVPPKPVGQDGSRFNGLIAAAAVAQHLDPDLLHALISVESNYRPDVVSARGAAGLTQLMPATARSYGVSDVFDPHQNIDAGARHLRWLLDRYRQDLNRALAAYNAGSGALEHAEASTGIWPNGETANYVKRVLARFSERRRSMGR